MSSEDGPVQQRWDYAPPPVLVPRPAADLLGPLTGRRIILRSPNGLYWLSGLRIVTEAHPRRARRGHSPAEPAVGVLAEPDYYRQRREREDGDACTVLVPFEAPLSQVWVEEPVDSAGLPAPAPDQHDIPPKWRSPAVVDDPARPPVRWPLRVAALQRMTGARVLAITPDGARLDLRAIGEPRRCESPPDMLNDSRGFDSLGEPITITMVSLCTEDAYFRWAQTGVGPREIWDVDTTLVWAV